MVAGEIIVYFVLPLNETNDRFRLLIKGVVYPSSGERKFIEQLRTI